MAAMAAIRSSTGWGPTRCKAAPGSTAHYVNAAAGMTISVANPSINTGEAAGDTFTDVEGFQLSAHDDIFYGGAGQNFAIGYGGTDLLLVDSPTTSSKATPASTRFMAAPWWTRSPAARAPTS